MNIRYPKFWGVEVEVEVVEEGQEMRLVRCFLSDPPLLGFAIHTLAQLRIMCCRLLWHDETNWWHPPKEGIDQGLVGRLLRLPWVIV